MTPKCHLENRKIRQTRRGKTLKGLTCRFFNLKGFGNL
jgi:hypothetical protein